MKKQLSVSISTVGFAIFTMLFGSGNILYPIKAGVLAGSKHSIGVLGFLLTGVVLPLLGLIAMILFDGNYITFFNRVGRVPGFLAILFCMLIIGPFIVMPRCVTVPYDMLSPFFPNISLFVFSIGFCLVTFVLTYKESKLLDLLGKYMSPLLIGSLGLIIGLGLMGPHTTIEQHRSSTAVFFEQVVHGFQTLDLLAALFFAYIIIRMIKSNKDHADLSSKQLAIICLKGSVITATLMAAFYIGFNLLGAYHAHLVTTDMNGAEIFRTIALNVLGEKGIILLVFAVLITCLSTMTALAAVFAEYLRNEVFGKSLSYVQCLTIGLCIATVISNFGLTNILNWSFPIITAGYPIIVTITLCNIAYKLFNFQWIKLPVFVVTAIMAGLSLSPYIIA